MEFPAAHGELLQAGEAFPVCQGKDINHDFVNKVVDGQPVQQTDVFPAGDFCGVNEWTVFLILLTDEVQHGISGEQREGASLVPEREALPVRPDPL